jgi:hypothetical protein
MAEFMGEWVVLKAAPTSWMFTSIPLEAAEILGCSEEVVEKYPRHLRTLAFLNRGEGRLRIVPSFNSQALLQKEMYGVVSFCSINPHNAIRMTEAVVKYLGMEVHRKDAHHIASVDPVAFVTPVSEYYAMLKNKRKPGEEKSPGHVYVARPMFKDKWVWSNVEELEAMGERRTARVRVTAQG